jgi:Putative beta-barrel porin-2, OmpL-like. bbp2
MVVAGVSLLAANVYAAPAFAQLKLPGPIDVDGGPLGELQVSGGIDGLFYGISGLGDRSLLGNGKAVGAQSFTNDITVKKSTGILRFVVDVHPSDTLHFGQRLSRPSVKTFTLGPLYAAFITLAPVRDFTVSVGQVYSVEGYESSLDWKNANILVSPLYSVKNSSSRGISASYVHGPVTSTLVFGDGFDSGAFNTFQVKTTYSFDPQNAVTLFGKTNVGRTGPNTFAYGGEKTGYGFKSHAALVNSTTLGGYYEYRVGDLKLVPEVQYVYARPDHIIGITKFTSNLGALLISDYHFGDTPWSIGGMVFYYRNNGGYGWYLNPHSAGLGLGLTPTWQKGHVFVRAEAGLIHLTNIGNGVAFGNDGNQRNQVTGILEAGLLF